MSKSNDNPRSRVLQKVKKSGAQKVKVAITDIDGILRGKYIHLDKFASALYGGFGFCDVVFGWDSADVCYDDVRYTGWHTGYPDAQAVIDPGTHRRIPWDDETPFFLADFVTADGAPLPVCPRQTLKRVVERAKKAGFTAKFGLEFEWFNFDETPDSLAAKGHADPTPLTPGMFGYSVLRSSLNQPYFSDLMDQLREFDVPLEGLHTETGPGVYEAAILVADPLEAADRGVLFKTGVKEIAYRHGFMASFMAKWNSQLPGCSGHIHQSLWTADGDRNVFHDAADPHRMSPEFRRYVAGQLRLMPELLALYAPTVNSYKRLVEGMWAPTRVTWAVDNRTAALRVIPGSAKSTRLETRVGGADLNPYLGVAAALGSGLYAIEKGWDLEQPPVVGNAYRAEAVRLPRTLAEAADRLDRSEAARDLFGDDFVDHFVATRRWEWQQFQQAVTSWELQRYFEVI